MYRHLPSAGPDELPVANQIAEKILCLPIFPDLTDEEQGRIIAALQRISRSKCSDDVNEKNVNLGELAINA
ncbi:dTDP-4-amino-4,6-dideoxy-D-glucose transaminase [compost metagenome]